MTFWNSVICKFSFSQKRHENPILVLQHPLTDEQTPTLAQKLFNQNRAFSRGLSRNPFRIALAKSVAVGLRAKLRPMLASARSQKLLSHRLHGHESCFYVLVSSHPICASLNKNNAQTNSKQCRCTNNFKILRQKLENNFNCF